MLCQLCMRIRNTCDCVVYTEQGRHRTYFMAQLVLWLKLFVSELTCKKWGK